jgi:hypothetical protein
LQKSLEVTKNVLIFATSKIHPGGTKKDIAADIKRHFLCRRSRENKTLTAPRGVWDNHPKGFHLDEP